MFVSDAGPATRPELGSRYPNPARPPAEFTLGELDREITSLAADINAATCRWLTLVAEFERRDGHEEFGFVSCSSWLAWRCSLTPRAAREQVRVARSLTELPGIRGAFGAGTLSYSKVRALSRVAEPAMEPELLELAEEATAAQLERLLRGYGNAIAEDAHARAQAKRHLTTSWDEDGSLSIRGSLPAEEGAAFLRALGVAREELVRERRMDGAFDGPAILDEPTEASDAATQRPRITNADSLMAVAEAALVGGVRAGAGGDRHQLVVHVDVDALASSSTGAKAVGEVGDGVPIPAETVRRLACDAAIVTLLERDGEPLSVGRKTRSIPPSIARALRARDRGCRFPGCGREHFVDAHHVQHWAHGGETSLGNLVRLCRHHHTLVHEGGFTVERAGDELRFRQPDGREIPAAPEPVEGSAERLIRAGLSVGAGAGGRAADCRPRSRGGRMDVDLGVFVLASLQERRTAGRGLEG